MKMEYPLNDVLPNIEHTRDRLLARIFEYRRIGLGKVVASDEDYELLYAYGKSSLLMMNEVYWRFVLALVTHQLAHDLNITGQEIEQLYGVLNEDDLKLQ